MKKFTKTLFWVGSLFVLVPILHAQTLNITSAPYNATTGSADNAAAIQAAINAVGSGGTVLVPSGTFLSGPITLKSNMTFQLAAGAILRMTAFGTFPQNTSFVYGTGLTNITINGSGTMDGQGAAWWTDFNNGNPDNRPPAMIYLSKGKGVTLMGITVKDSPKFHVQLLGTGSNIYVGGVSITAAWPSPNTDGIDLRGTNVLIENSYISDGDDMIQLGGTDPTSGVTIQNCTFGTGHGLSIGGYTQGGVSNLLVNNCTFNGSQYGIRWKTGRDRGGVMNNLTYSNLTMTGILLYPFFLTSWYPNPSSLPPTSDTAAATTSTTPYWNNITLRNITASTGASGAKSPGIMWAVPESPVSNVLMDGVTVTGPSGVNFEFHHARGVSILCNCRVDGAQPPTNVGAFDATITYPPCGGPTNTFTFTPTKTNTPVPQTNTFTFTPTKTNTVVPPTNTFSSTATRTNTATNTLTATPTRTNTPVPPTSTFTFTNTTSSTPTRTNTPVPPTATFTNSSTNTATNTLTATPSSTATRTNSPVPPTTTFTSTATPTRTFTTTSTNTSSNTPVPPTATATNTNSPVPLSATPTRTFTFTTTNSPVPPSVTPTRTLTATSTDTSTNSPVPPTVTFTNTNSPVPPSSTPTRTFTATPTDTSTYSPVPPTATNTNSPVPPMATFTNTNSPIQPSETPTRTLTATSTNTTTNTPVPPTVTFTDTNSPVSPSATPTRTFTASSTNTSTNTAIPPTATSTNTNSPVPPSATPTRTFTASSTQTSTNSPVPPTATFSGTSTSTSSFTPTHTFTATTTVTPTPTSIPTSTLTPTPGTGIQGLIFPNPVSGGTFSIQVTGMTTMDKVQVQVETTAFRVVNQLTFHGQGPGTATPVVPVTDSGGAPLANGIYYVIVRTEGVRIVLKLMVLR